MEINCNYEFCLQRELAGNAVITGTNLSSINLFIHTLTHPSGKTLCVGDKVAAFTPMVCRAFDHVTWYHMEDCATQEWPLPRLFPWSWLCTFRGDCLPYISQWHHWHSTPARYTGSACVCVEKQEGWETGEQFRPACTTDCMPMPHLEKFPSNSAHVLLSELRLKDSNSLDPNSTRTVHDTSLLIKTVKYVKCEALFAGSELLHGSGKSAGESSCPSNDWGPVKRDPTWMNEHGPADRGRSQRWGLLFTTEPRWHWGHRGQYDPCDLHVIPLLQLLKVRMQLVSISRNGGERKKSTCTSCSTKEKTFYWQQYICNQNLQTVNIKNET